MSPKRDPVPRARSAGHWLAGILLLGVLGGATVGAAVLLWENLDVRQLAPGLIARPGPLPSPEMPAPAAFLRTPFRAVFFSPPASRGFFPDSTFHSRAMAQWRALVADAGGEVREATTATELREISPADLLILAETPCLSNTEMSAVRAHLASGGSLVSNWAVGARDETCEWRGWRGVAEVTGAGDVRELETREGLYLTVPAETPLSPGLDPGTRIELRSEPSLALTLPGPRVYWSDWALNPFPDESGGGADVSAATVATDGGGRSVWFGFHLSQAATPRDSLALYRMVQNGILWAAGIPVAYVAPWPDGHRAALVLAQDVEAEPRNALAMAGLLRELSLPGTFYAVSQLVQEDSELAQALAAAGEVGSHSSDHAPLAGLSYQDQLVRLRRGWTDTRGWTGVAPDGLRPPEETFDASTIRAWKNAGGRYITATNQSRSAAPEIYGSGAEATVLLPRLLKDDYNVFVQEGGLRAERLTEAFLEGTRKMRALGGLAVVTTHTQIVSTDRRLDAIRTLANTVRAQGDWWIAEAREVAGWWEKRGGVRVMVQLEEGPGEGMGSAGDTIPAPSSQPRIVVEALGTSNLGGLWVDIVLPEGTGDLVPLVDGAPVPFAVTDWGMRVPVGGMEKREVRTITLASLRTERPS